MEHTGTKRLSKTTGYNRPDKTYQDNMSNQDIKEKLKDYKKVEDIRTVSIGTHLRYFTINQKTKEKAFRLGGNLNKIDSEGKYVILSNGTVSWSVQIPNAIFFQKMTENEFKEELKKELKKEIMTEIHSPDENVEALKKEIKVLKAKMEQYKENEKELKKKNDTLSLKLQSIETEIKKNKTKSSKK
jgi:hypothetical protein